MKKVNLAAIGLLTCFNATLALAGAHVEHGGKNPNTPSACKEAKITRFKPPALTLVAPGSEFSFRVSEAHYPNHIEVSVKKIIVPVSVENKGDFLEVPWKIA